MQRNYNFVKYTLNVMWKKDSIPVLFNPDSLTPADQEILGSIEKAVLSIDIPLKSLKCADCGSTLACILNEQGDENLDKRPVFCLPYPCAYNWSQKQRKGPPKTGPRKTAVKTLMETGRVVQAGGIVRGTNVNKTSICSATVHQSSVIQRQTPTRSGGTRRNSSAARAIGVSGPKKIRTEAPSHTDKEAPKKSNEIWPSPLRSCSAESSSAGSSSSSDSSSADSSSWESSSSDNSNDDDHASLSRDRDLSLPNVSQEILCWKLRCKELLSSVRIMWNLILAKPSHRPVNLGVHPYMKHPPSGPACLEGIKENLASNKYATPMDFHKDMALILEDSGTHHNGTHNPGLPTHQMMSRLKSFYEKSFGGILEDWNIESRVKPSNKVSRRRK